MEDKDQIIKDLKAELYDVSKHANQLMGALAHIAQVAGVDSQKLEDVISAVNEKFSAE